MSIESTATLPENATLEVREPGNRRENTQNKAIADVAYTVFFIFGVFATAQATRAILMRAQGQENDVSVMEEQIDACFNSIHLYGLASVAAAVNFVFRQ
ncbi:MAG: hypothetical protein COT84_03075 [Chlamydiae bacterium CG10_big_fil_rev_8_21_14_0_10_35_9]|nr:MAG: hypothetical protein COT84_03075 [Chlamydiae bacterium CG10_big_fil_rev_8_21_14_0_10_35_9]